MASSPEPSPVSEAASPVLLTPRSKIRALLATVDSSDDESGTAAARSPRFMLPSKPPSTRVDVQQSQREQSPPHSQQESDESDEPTRPRGKLASRMKGASIEPAFTSDASNERVEHVVEPEQTLMDVPSYQVDEQQHGDNSHDDDEDDDNEDDDNEDDEDLPIAPRRLKRRFAKESTPEAADTRTRTPSPRLFVSSPIQPSPSKSNDADSDDDLPAVNSDAFKALVERKRQERLAREAAEEAEQAQQRSHPEVPSSALDSGNEDDDGGITEDEDGRRLSQATRRTRKTRARKASKKAIEEMNRETQRMARSMQLAHEPKTRKKIDKFAFFEKFSIRSAKTLPSEPNTTGSSRPTSSHTEMATKDADTPPSSPPAFMDDAIHDSISDDGHVSDELPSLDQFVKSAGRLSRKDKGKGRAIDVQKKSTTEQPRLRVRVRMPIATTHVQSNASDDELEITKTTKDKINALFNSIPAKRGSDSDSLRVLKALAQIKSPGRGCRKDETACMSTGKAHASLLQKARLQAKMERQRRLEMLKAQGMVVQTADERERQEQEVEDLVAKAREEARIIQQRERDVAKRENKATEAVDWDDDSEDEEYEESANESDGEAAAMELSGSEDEQEQHDDEEEQLDDEQDQHEDGEEKAEGTPDVDEHTSNPFLDQDAKSDESQDEHNSARGDEAGSPLDQDQDGEPAVNRSRRRKYTAVLSDDEGVVEATPRPKAMAAHTTPDGLKTGSSAKTPYSVLRSDRKSFIPGIPVKGAAGMGLTQIFAGTMDDDEQPSSPLSGIRQSLMPDLHVSPQWHRRTLLHESSDDSSEDEKIMDSQRQDPAADDTQRLQLNLSQSQMRGLDSLLRDDGTSQFSQPWELTQDTGPQEFTPLKRRYVENPDATQDMVFCSQDEDEDEKAEEEPNGSPVVRKRRLRRKLTMMETMPVLEEEPTQPAAPGAFAALADGAARDKKRRLKDRFDRSKTKAKEMVEEQAQESEDEYAGLGGADGEDSDNESAGSVREIIDDEAGNDADERKIAAFYADRERARDEQEVEKLFKDITKGMQRRKRGADFDLSDSDDGGEARRRRKRRQFTKMQKALFADERIKKMAEDPGNQAFLRTVEDLASDEDMIEMADSPDEEAVDSQEDASAPRADIVPSSQPAQQPAPTTEFRRATHDRKPANLGEVRRTLSNLLSEREASVIPATDVESDSDDADDGAWSARDADKENRGPSAHTAMRVIDRLRLKRNLSASDSAARPAFEASAAAALSASTTAAVIRVPTLLRRATTNSSLMSLAGTDAQASAASSAFADHHARVHKAAAKSSGVSGFAPVAKAGVTVPVPQRLLDSERRRELKRARGAQQRRGVVGGLLAKGSFE